MIEIQPDRKHPRGGFAEITIDGVTPFEGPVEVAVYNSYQEKWLGPGGWQANKSLFAARSAEWGADQLRIVVGPDVVNHIEEDTPIKLEIGSMTWDVYWPDDINHGPDEAVVGDLGGTGAKQMPVTPTKVDLKPETPEELLVDEDTTAEAEISTDDPNEVDEIDDEDIEDEPKSKASLAMWGLALLLVIGVGAWFFLNQSGEDDGAVKPPVDEPDSVITPSPCGAEAIQAMAEQPFADQLDKLNACAGDVSADNALGFVERAAAADNPDALALFGALYDSAVNDEAIEGKIGLTFNDQPARAAEYYARAVKAGSSDAKTRLAAVCERLADESDTLSQSAIEDYCQ